MGEPAASRWLASLLARMTLELNEQPDATEYFRSHVDLACIILELEFTSRPPSFPHLQRIPDLFSFVQLA